MPDQTAIDRLRLNAELMRLVRERATIPPGAGRAIALARNASQIAATLQKLGLEPAPVSIYNSGSNPPEPTMTTPDARLMRSLMPHYAKHAEAVQAVRDVEAAGGKPTGVQKSAVTRTKTQLDYELSSAAGFGRRTEGVVVPTIEDLAQAYEAQVAAARAEREELAGQPTLTLDELTEKARIALEQVPPREKYGTREATVATMLPDGSTITCTAADDRRRINRYSMGYETVRTYQYKQDGKVISKDSLLKLIGGRARMTINEELRAAFEQQAPALEEDYYDWILRTFERQKQARGGRVPAWLPVSDPASEVIATLRMHSNLFGRGADAWQELDLDKLRTMAKKYSEETAVQWFYKTNAKLGEMVKPTLHNDKGGYVEVSGERNGRKVFMRQQRILKQSPKGVLFHQFPALLYVDGKFTTEEAYRKLFGDK